MGRPMTDVENGRMTTLVAPTDVNYEVTPVCNFRCEFCFLGELCGLKHPPFELVQLILKTLKQAGVFGVGLMGGEFFTYPMWREVVFEASRLGFFVGFVSNGTRLNEPGVAQWLAQYVRAGAISLHGAIPETHNKLTGYPKAYEIATGAIAACSEVGIQTNILFTPTKDNIDQVYSLGELARTRGWNLTVINIGRLVPEGRMRLDWESARLSMKDFQYIFDQAYRAMHDFGIKFLVADAIPLCLLDEKYHALVGGCSMGSAFGSITWDGGLKTCTPSSVILGNVLETSIWEIWQNPRIQELRSFEWLPKRCRECDLLIDCRGGCLISAARTEGSFYAPDEFLMEVEHELA